MTRLNQAYHDLCGRISDLIAAYRLPRSTDWTPEANGIGHPDDICPDCGTPAHIVDDMNADLLARYRKERGQ